MGFLSQQLKRKKKDLVRREIETQLIAILHTATHVCVSAWGYKLYYNAVKSMKEGMFKNLVPNFF